MQPEPPGEAWLKDAWAFGGVDVQSLQAELAAAEREKHALLQQAQATLQPSELQRDLDTMSDETHAGAKVVLAGSLPPKAPMPLKQIKPKTPLRSLSWGGGTKLHTTESPQPQRRSTFNHHPPAVDHPGGMSPKQPVQQSSIQQWLHQEDRPTASDTVDIHCVRQGVLQEVLQAVTLSTNATTASVDYSNLTVQAVAEVAKQQIADVSEAATKEKEAAVSKCIQAVQRRASKEALQQADHVVAKAQQAAADAAQRSDEEAAKLKHELEALKKEKRGLVQRCLTAERDLASAMVSQEKLQQQLSHARAASKASDNGRAQAEAQHQAELADLHQQLDAAQQGCADLQTQRQRSLQLASAAAAATDAHHQEMETLKDRYTACCHQQAVAVERLDQEVAQLVQEAEHTMTTVAQNVSALHGASCSSQAELRQQLQQLRAEVAELQKGSSSTGMGESLMQQSGLVEALIQVRQQLDAVGCADMGTLLRQQQQLSTQAMGSKQESAELQQQLQQQAEAHAREVADLARMTSKVQDLEFDLGNVRQSLQVKGEQCQALQGQCDQLQHEVDCLQAELAKDASATVKHQHALQKQAEKHDAALQHLQQQLQAASQQLEQQQQQAPLQAAKAYKAAVASCAKSLQELQDRYFHSTPVQPFTPGKQSPSSLFKHQAAGIVAAYSDFQQRRGSLHSMASGPHNPFGSPSSTLQRKAGPRGSLGASQIRETLDAWSHQASPADNPSRGMNPSSRLSDSMRSASAEPVSRTSFVQPGHKEGAMHDNSVLRTSSAALQKQGLSHQPSEAALSPDLPAGFAGSSQPLQHDASLLLQKAALKSSAVLPDTTSALELGAWVLPEVVPDPSWLSPFMQQMLQLEGCLLNALTALLTQTPSESDSQKEQNGAGKGPVKKAPPRRQCWPKAAKDSQQLGEDTTGEMVRAMSAQKRDLSRRLKAAESSNRQLRAELRELGAGLRNGPDGCPISSQLPSTVGTSCNAVRGSWQEMAAVLDMLQDISIPSGNSQLGRPFSAMSPATSPQRQPRCTSVTSSPDYVSSAAHRKPRCASALSPLSPLQAGSEQAGVVPRQQFSHDVMSPLATSRSRTPNGKIRGSPLSACGNSSHRQDWQS